MYIYSIYIIFLNWVIKPINCQLLGRWIRWRVDSFILEPGNWRQSHAVQNLIKENRSEYDFNLASWHFHQHFPPSLELASYPPNPMLSFFPKKNSPLGWKPHFQTTPVACICMLASRNALTTASSLDLSVSCDETHWIPMIWWEMMGMYIYIYIYIYIVYIICNLLCVYHILSVYIYIYICVCNELQYISIVILEVKPSLSSIQPVLPTLGCVSALPEACNDRWEWNPPTGPLQLSFSGVFLQMVHPKIIQKLRFWDVFSRKPID